MGAGRWGECMKPVRALVGALAAIVLSGQPARAQDVGVFDTATQIAEQAVSICAAVVFDGQSFESQLDGNEDWYSVDPRGTGSNLATHAWQSTTVNTTHVMRLPNGGCSFGIDRGDSEALRAHVQDVLASRAPFELISQQPARSGRATMYAYCVAEDHPRVMSIVAAERGSRPNFVLNMFRASDVAPSFCRRS